MSRANSMTLDSLPLFNFSIIIVRYLDFGAYSAILLSFPYEVVSMAIMHYLFFFFLEWLASPSGTQADSLDKPY